MNDVPKTTQDDELSKTQKKNQMHSLQGLGMRLTKLSDDTLKKIGLSDDLLQALLMYKKITSNSALKRQAQYIGRLMRELDSTESIEDFLAKLDGDNVAHNAFLQRLENIRQQLIENDDALVAFINEYPHVDITELRTLIRNTRKEQAQNKPPKAFRALFQLLKQHMQPNAMNIQQDNANE
ncbi:ribosome biogenesis factor YjgA [Neisseria sp. Ec49-e6-T10]|uniref:ribosome biogenesis factor YjgA n=1 Tax=Neisseria sp. Ec49-e6-T10 TaxID=3140744 RepID=UPI003EB8A64B